MERDRLSVGSASVKHIIRSIYRIIIIFQVRNYHKNVFNPFKFLWVFQLSVYIDIVVIIIVLSIIYTKHYLTYVETIEQKTLNNYSA